jgi:hypothetical protein
MPWTEVVTAVSTAITAIVIAATVVVGYRQLKHLRQATQLDGTLKIFDEINRDDVRSAIRFVIADLPEKMRNARFAAEVSAVGAADEHVHQELQVMRLFEKIGTYVRYRFIDPDIVCDYAGPWVRSTWEVLQEQGVVSEHRKNYVGDALWENYETLYRRVCEFDARRSTPVSSAPSTEQWAKFRKILHGGETSHE